MKKIIGLVGNFHKPSRTNNLIEAIIQMTESHLEFKSKIYNLASLGASFPTAQSIHMLDRQAKSVIKDIIDADILVIGVPTWNASYPGMFKHLFDLIAPDALVGKKVILSATGGSERHALMIDYQLRPLFNYFKACPVSTSIFATEQDFTDNHPTVILRDRIEQAVKEAMMLSFKAD